MTINCLSPTWLQRIKGIPWKVRRTVEKKAIDTLFPFKVVPNTHPPTPLSFTRVLSDMGYNGSGAAFTEEKGSADMGFSGPSEAQFHGYTSGFSKGGGIDVDFYRYRRDGLVMFGSVKVDGSPSRPSLKGYDLKNFRGKRQAIVDSNAEIEKAMLVWMGKTEGFNACRCNPGNPCPEHPNAIVTATPARDNLTRLSRFKCLRWANWYVQRYLSETGRV